MALVTVAAVDYRFFRIAAADVALVVDVIRRANERDIEIRASYWAGSEQGVARSFTQAIPSTADLPPVDGVGPGVRCVGSAGEVSWDLTISPGDRVVDARGGPLRHLRAFDLQLVSRPDAQFNGWLKIGGISREVDGHGLLCHYWGRRLPSRWFWVSANVPGLIVDASVMRSRLWNLPWPRVTVGYVFVSAGGRRAFHIGPLNSIVTAHGDATKFTIAASRPGQRIELICQPGHAAYNDLGGGILQTLHGDVSIDGWGATVGQAGVEVLNRPS